MKQNIEELRDNFKRYNRHVVGNKRRKKKMEPFRTVKNK